MGESIFIPAGGRKPGVGLGRLPGVDEFAQCCQLRPQMPLIYPCVFFLFYTHCRFSVEFIDQHPENMILKHFSVMTIVNLVHSQKESMTEVAISFLTL